MDVQTIKSELEQDLKKLSAFLDADPEPGEVYQGELYAITVTRRTPQTFVILWGFDAPSETWARTEERPVRSGGVK
jgi:hypothetical protein